MTVDSMGREGRELFRHLLEKGLSMEHFIDSDFVMANDRLARFYGLPAVEGDAFVPVKLPRKSERGGLVAQAGFLKLTSTDFATSPIHRGSWILKNLYNERIEPPADVLINEPDIRGTTTVREAILKHQDSSRAAPAVIRRSIPWVSPLNTTTRLGASGASIATWKNSLSSGREPRSQKKLKFTEGPD